MTRSRIALTGIILALAVCAVGVPAAGASKGTSVPNRSAAAAPQYTQPVTGVAKNGKKFRGTFGIQRFVARGDAVYAVGTLKGRLKGRRVTRSNVAIPEATERSQHPTTTHPQKAGQNDV